MDSNIIHSQRHIDSKISFPKLLLRCMIFLSVFALFSLLSSLTCSAIFFNLENPTARIELAAICALYFSVAISSILLTRINKEKWLLGGLILGVMIYFLTLILALFVSDDTNSKNIIFRALIPLISVFFAFISRKRAKSHSKIKLKRHKIRS